MQEKENFDQDSERSHKEELPNHISKTKTVMGALGSAAMAYGAQNVYEHHHKKSKEEKKEETKKE